MGNVLGTAELDDLAPIHAEERKELNLSHNVNHHQYLKHLRGEVNPTSLQEIPWAVRDAVSLYERMDISFNRLTSIPVEIPMRVPHLSYVNLSHNQLASLPESFGFLFHLQTVLLNNNKLKKLPSSFVHLDKLEKLDLSHNSLDELFEDIGEMKALTKLNLSYNNLKQLPLSLGSAESKIQVLLAKYNNLKTPPQQVADAGSTLLLKYLRDKNVGKFSQPKLSTKPNVFPRVRGNQLPFSVMNAHSANTEYIQNQTGTSNTATRLKSPLIPPANASTLDAMHLCDRIIGMIYGAAIGDAIGIATTGMTSDEAQFHYDPSNLSYSHIVRDALRTRWQPGDWTDNFDQMILVLDTIIHWAGVVDELDFAKRLKTWVEHGFPELGDQQGYTSSDIIHKVVNEKDYTKQPHEASRRVLAATPPDVIQIQAPGADPGALCRSIILGVPHFHNVEEVASNSVRICLASHAHPQCISASVVSAVIIAHILQNKSPVKQVSDVKQMLESAFSIIGKYLPSTKNRELLQTLCQCLDVNSAHKNVENVEALTPLIVALQSLTLQEDFRAVITRVAMHGGAYSNTTCCLTGAMLGCKLGYGQLPSAWVTELRKKQTDWLNIKINTLLDMFGFP